MIHNKNVNKVDRLVGEPLQKTRFSVSTKEQNVGNKKSRFEDELFDNSKNLDWLLTTQEVAQLLRVSPLTIRNWRYRGVLPDICVVRVGPRLIRYRYGEILRWQATNGG